MMTGTHEKMPNRHLERGWLLKQKDRKLVAAA
jgi:hypothetical protein